MAASARRAAMLLSRRALWSSLSESPLTTCQAPSLVAGKPNMRPSSTPYSPVDGNATVAHRPSVPCPQSRMWSTDAEAAEAAEDKSGGLSLPLLGGLGVLLLAVVGAVVFLLNRNRA